MSHTNPSAKVSKVFNWDEAKARLARSASAWSEEHLSDDEARSILELRARKLAQPPVALPDASQVLVLVTFMLGGERFAIEARFVREMIRLEHVTPIPDAPQFLLGMTNLRGEVIAVLDVRDFFDVRAGATEETRPALVLGEGRIEFALATDRVEEVSTFRTTDFFDPTGTISTCGRDWVQGITRDGAILLDGKAMLSDPRLFVDEA